MVIVYKFIGIIWHHSSLSSFCNYDFFSKEDFKFWFFSHPIWIFLVLCVYYWKYELVPILFLNGSLGRLQRIQNSAARLVTRTRSHESISPILHTLHWLPVKDRLVFKLLIIAYKCQHHLAPHYLQQLLQEYQPSRLLRSSTKQLLTPHNVVTKSYGQRSFQYSMPHLWNQLPDDIRECSSLDQFKSLLKSHLFVK